MMMDAPAVPRLRPFFDDAGRLRQWPTKFSLQQAALAWLASAFEPGRRYTEKQVNEVLNAHHTFGDWALLRRGLCDARLLVRETDGSAYWRAPEASPPG